ncbi:MAG: hypothetical protein ABH819_00645 [Patescibacteria group bacterium]
MKIKNVSDLVFVDDKIRLNIAFSPEIAEGFGKHDKSDYIFADILIWLKSFNLKIKKIRSKYKIVPSEYPKKPTVEELIELFLKKINYEKYKEFEKDISQIQNDYHLTENWTLSLRIAVVTDTLLVPASETIHFHYPDYEIEKTGKKKNSPKTLLKLSASILDSPEIQKMDTAMKLSKYPSIYFTRKISIGELKKWIDANKSVIRSIQHRLPSKKYFKRDYKTLFWGKIAWIFKQDGVNSWAEISKLVQKEADQIIEEQGEKDNKYLLNLPDDIEIRKCYKRFINSLQSAETTNK